MTERADTLVVAFNFAPFSDGSSVTLAKRVVANGKRVDVVGADLSSIRARDDSLMSLVEPFVNNHELLRIPLLFSDQQSITPFVENGARAVRGWGTRTYEKLYSRSMWPHSHFLAARLRLDGVSSYWSAEFSDPLLWHVDGRRRTSATLRFDSEMSRFLQSVGEPGQALLRGRPTILEWAQFLPFLLADELVFTNEQQLDVMLGDVPAHLQEEVMSRSRISPHPTLPKEHYARFKTSSDDNAGQATDDSIFRIGYFGTFYPNRGGGELLEALSLLPHERRSRIRLEIYSADAGQVKSVADRLKVSENVSIMAPLQYGDFLVRMSSYSALLVTDIATSPFQVPSPFLPSKYSDYAGSNTDIMTITIPGSPLDMRDARYTAHVGDIDGITRMLASAIR